MGATARAQSAPNSTARLARALPFFEQEAKKRQGEGGGRGRKKTSAPIGGEVSRDHRAVDDAAIAFDCPQGPPPRAFVFPPACRVLDVDNRAGGRCA